MSDPSRRSFFSDYIKRQESRLEKPLPLTHTAKAVLARDILAAGSIAPSFCDVMKDDRVYAFYGRASYRVTGDGVIKAPVSAPVCFILKEDLLDRSHQIFPFDTGAYKARMYKHHIGEELNCEDFEISSDRNNIGKLVSLLYDDNRRYIAGRVCPSRAGEALKRASGEFEAEAYIQLALSIGRNEPDDRVSTIEVIFRDKIPVGEGVEAVILPDTLLNSSAPWIQNAKASGVRLIPYAMGFGKGPEYQKAQIDIVLEAYLDEAGYLDE